ncbi:hypothetical protein NKH77_40240 [Streptomyces sp. M19]
MLWALREAGAAPCPEAEEWLLDRVKKPAPGTPCGFYDGLVGIAWALDRIGHREQAVALGRLVAEQPWTAYPATCTAGTSASPWPWTTSPARPRAPTPPPSPVPPTAVPPSPPAGSPRPAVAPGRADVRPHRRRPALPAPPPDQRRPALLDLAATALRQDLARCRNGTDGRCWSSRADGRCPTSRRAAPVWPWSSTTTSPSGRTRNWRPRGRRSCPPPSPRSTSSPASSAESRADPPSDPHHRGDPATRRRVVRRHARLLATHAIPLGEDLAFPENS